MCSRENITLRADNAYLRFLLANLEFNLGMEETTEKLVAFEQTQKNLDKTLLRLNTLINNGGSNE